MQLARRLDSIAPSATIAVSTKAAELRRQGRDVIGLGFGEPDFDTPDRVKNAAKQAIDNGATKYTAVDGTPELKQAIAMRFASQGLEYQPGEIIVSAGAKQSIFNALVALLNPGDEVIIPAPYWVSYPDMVRLAGGTPVTIRTELEARFKLAPGQLADALSENTRALIINSPSNPTGMCYSDQELQELSAVLGDRDILCITDEIYDEIYWGEPPLGTWLSAAPQLQANTLVVNGVSKTYSMTGWRIGYAAGPAPLVAAMRKIQSQSTSCPSSVSQAAARAALELDLSKEIETMRNAFHKRSHMVSDRLASLPGIDCLRADGAFYAFPRLTDHVKSAGLVDDVVFCEKLLEGEGVALVPGSAFGAPNHVRLSVATSEATLEEALDRIERFVRAG